MALGELVIDAVGSLTAPASVRLTFGSVITPTLKDFGLYQGLHLPGLRSAWMSHGMEAMRHVLAGTSYRIGLLAPQAGQTTISTATAADSTLTISTNLNDNDRIKVGLQPDGSFSEYIYFKTAFNTTTYTVAQVLIGATIAITLTNLNKLLEGTGTNGTEYYDADQIMRNGFYQADYWHSKHKVQVATLNTGAGTIKIQSTVPGVFGNGQLASVDVGGARMAFNNTPFMTGGVNGSGTAPPAGEFEYAYQHLRAGDGGLSGRSALTNFTNGSNCNVNQTTFVAATARYAATHFRQLRTPTGAVDLFRIQDTTVATGEPYVDSLDDGEVDGTGLVGVGAIPYEELIYRLYAAGPPTIGRYSAYYKGSVWTGGALLAADYTVGTVTITNTTYTATFTTGKPKENWIGRTLKVSGDTVEYLIVDVSESAGTCQLNLPYSGTATGASYTVSDKRNPFALYYSVPLLPNNFPANNSLTDITSGDARGLTGLKAAWDSLVVWTHTGTHRVFGSPSSGFRLEPVGEGMGCFSGHSVVDVEGTLFWIGRDGIFMWNGSGDPFSLSKPPSPAGAFPKGIQRELDRINLDEAEMIVGVYNPSTRVIVWAVPMDGQTKNNYAIIYDTQSGAFTTDTLPSVTFLAAVPGVDGSHVTLAGCANGSLVQLDLGTCDGVFGVEPVQAFSAYAASTRTASGLAGMPTASNGLAGMPVLHVSEVGAVQSNIIATNTATAFITVKRWDTAPADGWFILGGIYLDVLTAKYDLGSTADKWIDRTLVSFVPQTLGQLYLAASVDEDDPVVTYNRTIQASDSADLSNEDGYKEFPCRTDIGRRLQQEFIALAPGFDVQVLSFKTLVGAQK